MTSLAQADTGSLAGGAQMEVWREIVRKDAAIVVQAVNAMVREYLSRAFPGRPVAAEFSFDTGTKLSAQESANVAATLKQAGWTVKQDELEQAVGFTLVKDEMPAPQPGLGAPLMNKAQKGLEPRARSLEDENAQSSKLQTPSSILTAFANDMSPAGKAVEELLKNPSKEAADALLAKLDTLLPDDPATAAVIAEAMAKEFGRDNDTRL